MLELERELYYDPTVDGEQLTLCHDVVVDTSWASDELADQGAISDRLPMQFYLSSPNQVLVYIYRTNTEFPVNVNNFNMLNESDVRGLASYVLACHGKVDRD